MRIDVSRTSKAEKSVLWRLMQLYISETAAFDGSELNAEGVYEYPYFDSYWTGDDRYCSFLIRVDGALAGFALVSGWSYSGQSVDHSMAEFFVLLKYRHQGVGQQAVEAILKELPGVWESAEYAGNTSSIAFWRKVIGEITEGKYNELPPSERWPHGPIQRFEVG